MPRKIPRLLWVVLPLAYLIYFHALSGTGLLGPDEPRYASVARAMALSGDWITPRLWGVPWFEKPALLYWMTSAGFRAGLGLELAPRLPVALLAIGFLVFYWWILWREFGCRAAWMATLILGTSGLWIGYSQVGVTDIPLTATYSAGMLLALPWIRTRELGKRDTRRLPVSAAMFGLAALAKGVVPIALAAPLIVGRHWRDWLRPRVWLPFLLVAMPWYLLCYGRNGWAFIQEFFIVHTFQRVTSDALMHARPFWYYLPILPAAILPWTPLAGLLFRAPSRDPRRVFLLVWALVVLAAFSIPINKLPGYILPALPAIAALLALALDEVPDARWWLAACGALLIAFPVAARMLPAALLSGLSRAPRPAFEVAWLAPLAAAILVWELERRGRRLAAVLVVAAGAGIGTGYLKSVAVPELDRSVSARSLARQIQTRAADVCLGDVKRDWEYGLDYYVGVALPGCEDHPSPLQVLPAPGNHAQLTAKP
jgi:4-amino-4-deoxy-L-arabinose transferase-like glycosyltransferase